MTISSANKGDQNAKVLLTSLIIILSAIHSVSSESPVLQLWKRFPKYVTDSRACPKALACTGLNCLDCGHF